MKQSQWCCKTLLDYYYVEALKRVMKPAKLNEQPLRNICEQLTNRLDRIDKVLRRWKEVNPRPWP